MMQQQGQPGRARVQKVLAALMALVSMQMAAAKEVKIPTSNGFLIVNVPDEGPITEAKPANPSASKQPAAAPQATKADSVALQRNVESALKAWAAAWSKKDLNAYIAAYTPDFAGGKTRTIWEQERRARIQSKRNIEVTLSGIKIEMQGDKAQAVFSQAYKADSFSETSSKRVDLVRSGNNWLIAKESTGS